MILSICPLHSVIICNNPFCTSTPKLLPSSNRGIFNSIRRLRDDRMCIDSFNSFINKSFNSFNFYIVINQVLEIKNTAFIGKTEFLSCSTIKSSRVSCCCCTFRFRLLQVIFSVSLKWLNVL